MRTCGTLVVKAIAICLVACGGHVEDATRSGRKGGADAPGGADASSPSSSVSVGGGADASQAADGKGDATVDGATGAISSDAAAQGSPDAAAEGTPPPSESTCILLNPAHTGAVTDPTLVPPLAQLWSFEPPVGQSVSYPVIADGHVYFTLGGAGSPTQLIALDEHTGRAVWGPVDVAGIYVGGHAYEGGRVFTVTSAASGSSIQAFDAASGTPLWTQPVASSGVLYASAPIPYQGTLYVAYDAGVAAFDEVTGAIRWSAPTNSANRTVPAVTDDGVFVSYSCGETYAFDRSTGHPLWHHATGCDSGEGEIPIVYGGNVYVMNSSSDPTNQHLDVLDVGTGAAVGSLSCFTYPSFDRGRAFCDRRTPLVAIDLATGQEAWTFPGDGQLNLSPFVAGGTAYVASDTGMIFGVDETTGHPTWATSADGLGSPGPLYGAEGILVTQLYAGGAVVAYAHVDLPDASVTLGDAAPPAPIDLVTGVDAIDIALDDTSVYWADFNGQQILRVAKAGGSPEVIASTPSLYPTAIALDTTGVSWAFRDPFQGSPPGIMSATLDGGMPTSLATLSEIVTGRLVAAGGSLYWAGPGVQSVPVVGGPVTAVVSDTTVGAVATDGANLYWSAAGGLYEMPLAGGAATNITPSAQGMALAVDGTNVYYAANTTLGSGVVGYVPLGGGSPTVLADGRIGSMMAIAIDDANVYWIEGFGTIGRGAVAAVPKAGGQAMVLAAALQDPMALAVDTSGIYFANTADGRISRISK
jgi:outer membrane protein assembly factor BamB